MRKVQLVVEVESPEIEQGDTAIIAHLVACVKLGNGDGEVLLGEVSGIILDPDV